MDFFYWGAIPFFKILLNVHSPYLAVLIDVPSTPRFLVDVFSFVVHAEFEVGVLALEEFRWKIFLGEDLEPLVVLVCDTIRRMRLVDKPSLRGC